MNAETLDFIRLHADDDVRQLALQGRRDNNIDMPFALVQIAGRQKARQKLPSWAAVDGLLYPPHLNMEQCSSELTACYKASLFSQTALTPPENSVFADLTGGLGVDFSFLARSFTVTTYVEQDASLCLLARHNLPLLGLASAAVVNSSAEDFLSACPPLHLVFIDPARRDAHGARTYSLADCTPNVLQLMPLLTAKARRILMKLSPMLDWRKAVADVEAASAGRARVSAIHIVSVANECKELLLDVSVCAPSVVADSERDALRVVCVNLQGENAGAGQEIFEFQSPSRHSNPTVLTPQPTALTPQPTALTPQPASLSPHPTVLHAQPPVFDFQSSVLSPQSSQYLYEPNASIMKSGGFSELSRRFGLSAISPNSHLFVSPHFIGEFPGRKFVVQTVTTLNKRQLRTALAGISRANVAVRNFPLSADALRQRLRLKDGGSTFLFGTSDAQGNHLLLVCQKA